MYEHMQTCVWKHAYVRVRMYVCMCVHVRARLCVSECVQI